MKLVAAIFGVFVLAVVGVLAYAATRPDVFQISRTATINATPERIFALINDLKSWTAWSPYEKRDPAMKRSYGPITSGKGATYAWDGDNNVGSGSMEIVNAPVPSKVTIKLDFARPMEAHNIAEFTLEPNGSATSVTWSMQGPTPFVGKLLHVFVDVEKMVGRDFETGLANLKALAER
jgi:carbon monoxide dehydrogenase subunit G